jgi:HK97 gp10 family phage protein
MSVRLDLGLTATGGEQLAKALQALSASVRRRALLGALKSAAWPIAGRAAELAPIDPATRRHLKDWIVVQTQPVGTAGAEAAVAIGPAVAVFWGLFLEFGTVKMSGHPFLRPAFDDGTDRTLSILREELWTLLNESIANASTRGSSTGGGLL